MTPQVQQRLIIIGFIGLVVTLALSLLLLTVLAIVHDGTLVDRTFSVLASVIQDAIWAIGVVVGLHTVTARFGALGGSSAPDATPPPTMPAPDVASGT